MSPKCVLVSGLALLMVLSTLAVAGFGVAQSRGPVAYHAPVSRSGKAPAGGTAGTFAFVSNFEDKTLGGWTSVAGATPTVTTRTMYFGEPSLASTANRGVQIDIASNGFVGGAPSVSFQVAVNTGRGAGYFALADASNNPVATVGIVNSQVMAGANLSSLASVGPVPTGTAYPDGWVYLAANIYNASTKKTPASGWVMDVYVDRSDQIAFTVPVPNAAAYAEALIETGFGTVYYTNIVVTTYEIPIYIPGYNNMEGYGQGSGLLVQLLPAFTTLRANMVLNSWNTPQVGILSFQINAMNMYGTTRSTCGGFFQLGIDLDPNGTISPWYVPGKNCIAHFFLSSNNPAIQPGVASPAGTHLVLSIADDTSAKSIVFTIVDTTIARTWTASIPYSGGPFYGTYTQLEWQPSISVFPIADYKFSGVLYDQTITTMDGKVMPLKSDYMLPFTLDAPPQWSLTYYQDSLQGYDQLA